jgi:hypothetical protein
MLSRGGHPASNKPARPTSKTEKILILVFDTPFSCDSMKMKAASYNPNSRGKLFEWRFPT